MSALNPVDLILTKRDGGTLSPAQIEALVHAYTAGDVPDYQVSAFLMAAFLRGMDDTEAFALADAMLHSGVILDLDDVPGRKVDKHSTGGVGDKVSLVLAPIVAACGVPVPMISGRGLGHTGGTLDKLESIPGFRTDLDIPTYREQLQRIGAVLIGQTADIAPADRKLYALRDVTGTVEFIPFIAASIMSKKLAEGIDALVLDVKCGRGAFMKTEADARALAEALAGIGQHFGTQTVAWMTRMDVPLGRTIGNWPETAEATRCLQGAEVPDLMEVTYTLAGEMLHLGGVAETPAEGVERAREAVASGAAFEKWVEITEAQGGDASVLDDPDARLREAPAYEVTAPVEASGYVTDLDALALGQAAVHLGAGRRVKEDAVDPLAGITLNKKPGDPVEEGEVLAVLHTHRAEAVADVRARVRAAYTWATEAPPTSSALMGRLADGQWTNESSAAS